jgi:lysophospholipase L1-like esterase
MHSLLRFIPISTSAARSDASLATACRRLLLGAALASSSLGLCACAEDEPTESGNDFVEAGGGADGTDAGSGVDSSDAGNGGASGEDPGKGDGSDVIMIGDSWMSLFDPMSGIQGGVLKASGQPYRSYSIGGTTLLGGGALDALFAAIPVQYDNAIAADPDVKTVIMTGGGNDILQSGLQADCDMNGDACGAQVVMILDRLSQLWADMAADGVKDVVYIFYATPAGKTVDFELPDGDGAVRRCANVPAPLRCHTLATLDIVMNDIPDGIHPSQAASDRIGQAVVELMASRGMRR